MWCHPINLSHISKNQRPTVFEAKMSLAKLIFSASMADFYFSWNSRWIVRRPTSIIVWPSADSLLCLSSVGRHLVIWNFLKCRPADPVWRPKIDQRSTGLSGDWFWQIGWRTTDHIRITFKKLPSISGGQTDDVLLQICWSKKIKECPRGYR